MLLSGRFRLNAEQSESLDAVLSAFGVSFLSCALRSRLASHLNLRHTPEALSIFESTALGVASRELVLDNRWHAESGGWRRASPNAAGGEGVTVMTTSPRGLLVETWALVERASLVIVYDAYAGDDARAIADSLGSRLAPAAVATAVHVWDLDETAAERASAEAVAAATATAGVVAGSPSAGAGVGEPPADFSGSWSVDAARSDSLGPAFVVMGVPWLVSRALVSLDVTTVIRHAGRSVSTVEKSSMGVLNSMDHVADGKPTQKVDKEGRTSTITCSLSDVTAGEAERGVIGALRILSALPDTLVTDNTWRLLRGRSRMEQELHVSKGGKSVTVRRILLNRAPVLAPPRAVGALDPFFVSLQGLWVSDENGGDFSLRNSGSVSPTPATTALWQLQVGKSGGARSVLERGLVVEHASGAVSTTDERVPLLTTFGQQWVTDNSWRVASVSGAAGPVLLLSRALQSDGATRGPSWLGPEAGDAPDFSSLPLGAPLPGGVDAPVYFSSLDLSRGALCAAQVVTELLLAELTGAVVTAAGGVGAVWPAERALPEGQRLRAVLCLDGETGELSQAVELVELRDGAEVSARLGSRKFRRKHATPLLEREFVAAQAERVTLARQVLAERRAHADVARAAHLRVIAESQASRSCVVV